MYRRERIRGLVQRASYLIRGSLGCARIHWRLLHSSHRLLVNVVLVTAGFVGFVTVLGLVALGSFEDRWPDGGPDSWSNRFAQFLLSPPGSQKRNVGTTVFDQKIGEASARHGGAERKAGRRDTRDTGKRMGTKTDQPTNQVVVANKLAQLFGADGQSTGTIMGGALGGELVGSIGQTTGEQGAATNGLGGLGLRAHSPGGSGASTSTFGVGSIGLRGRATAGAAAVGDQLPRPDAATVLVPTFDRPPQPEPAAPARAPSVDERLATMLQARQQAASPAAGAAAATADPSGALAAVMGSLDKEIIRRVIRSSAAGECLKAAAARSPASSGRVVSRFVITASGSVTSAKINESTITDHALQRCLLEQVERLRFPAPAGGGIVIVSYPFAIGTASAPPPAAASVGDIDIVDAESAAGAFLAQRVAIEDVTFQEAAGYWSNTYVPGDPELRMLQLQLASWDRRPLSAAVGRPLALHEAAAPQAEPFDAPTSSALAVYLHADHSFVDGPTRMLVQVGLKGTARHGGLRGTTQLGVVLDLRQPPSDASAATMRALLEALVAARQTGDRFVLYAAGPGGGRVLDVDQFRYGPVAVALKALFATPPPGARDLPLAEAVRQAAVAVAPSTDRDAPLGSSALLVVTSEPLREQLAPTLAVAEQSAIDGVSVSAVAIGQGARIDEIDQLALAGQGQRRLLTRPADAAAMVDRELTAASRAVARAVRLRIRLAPGVKLVDVVGSRRLDLVAAQQVRLAEQSIDRRLAHSLGIEADRGVDDEGIQIVIPAFDAGDSHAILLDVVATAPGPIADVSVRYKDLVYLRNGLGRANLSLPHTRQASAALEHNVLANYLAQITAQRLREAGAVVDRHDARAASRLLATTRQLLVGLQQRLPELRHDLALAIDAGMLAEYAALLEREPAISAQSALIASSLRLAGWRKLLPPPEPGDPAPRSL